MDREAEGIMSDAAKQLLKAVGVGRLTEHFEYLDDLRESGACNMSLAGWHLNRAVPCMAKLEAQVIAQAWRDTFNTTLPAEDRVEKALS